MIYCAAEDYMAGRRSIEDVGTLEMALVGFQIEKQRIDSRIQEIHSQLRGNRTAAPAKKRQLSESARKRISAAQKRRWAEHRKKAAQAAKGQTAKVSGAAS